MIRKIIACLFMLGFGLVSLPAAADQMAAKVQGCIDCHGPDGVSQHDDMPTIAGLSAPVHEDALFMYQDKARPCASSAYRCGDTGRAETDMCQIAAAMSEDDIVAVAAFFAGKTFVPMKQEFDPAKAAAGKEIHDRDCSRCHTDNGSNPADDASIIAGQPMGYLRTTFAEYRADTREQPKKMKPKIDALSDAEVEALVHFYASQQ